MPVPWITWQDSPFSFRLLQARRREGLGMRPAHIADALILDTSMQCVHVSFLMEVQRYSVQKNILCGTIKYTFKYVYTVYLPSGLEVHVVSTGLVEI